MSAVSTKAQESITRLLKLNDTSAFVNHPASLAAGALAAAAAALPPAPADVPGSAPAATPAAADAVGAPAAGDSAASRIAAPGAALVADQNDGVAATTPASAAASLASRVNGSVIGGGEDAAQPLGPAGVCRSGDAGAAANSEAKEPQRQPLLKPAALVDFGALVFGTFLRRI